MPLTQAERARLAEAGYNVSTLVAVIRPTYHPTCLMCGRVFVAHRSGAFICSATCKVRKYRADKRRKEVSVMAKKKGGKKGC